MWYHPVVRPQVTSLCLGLRKTYYGTLVACGQICQSNLNHARFLNVYRGFLALFSPILYNPLLNLGCTEAASVVLVTAYCARSVQV